MKQKQNFAQLFHPRSLAIIGASATKGKVGNMIARNVLAHNYCGDVYFVNQKRKTILGKRCFSSLAAIGKKIDCAIVAVPAMFVEDVVSAGMDVCKNFVVISAGFGETGIEGHNREMHLKKLAQKHHLHILGPNCLGFLIPSIGLNASFATGLPQKGRIAMISQSGALAVAFMDKALEENIGFSAMISIGNKMHIGAPEIIDYFSTDENTDVIALYLEGVARGEHFLRAIAKAIENGKRVIVLKAGRTQRAQKAIALHTGSLAGSDVVFTAALEKVGAIRAYDMEEFFALLRFGAYYAHTLPTTVRIGVVTNAGGPGVLTTDAIAQQQNLTMSAFEKTTKNFLVKHLPPSASVHNPVDLLGDAALDRYEIAVKKILADKNVDIVFVLLTPQDQTPVDDIANFLTDIQKKMKKPIVASFIGGVRVRKGIDIMRKGGVLHFSLPQTAIMAIATLATKRTVYFSKKKPIRKEHMSFVQKIIDSAENRDVLYFAECRAIAQKYDIPVSRFWDITKGLDARTKISYPCVVKVDNPHILHKTDRGGVILPIQTLKELHHARKILLNRFPQKTTRIIVQPLLKIKTELIIGLQRDPVFGTVIIAGLGGIYTEIFKRVDSYIAPLSLREIVHKLENGNIGFLFKSTRGEQKYHSEVIARIILNLSLIGMENTQIEAIDINPLLVYNDDTPDVAVDFKIILQK